MWTCLQTGACCRMVTGVTMTYAERRQIEAELPAESVTHLRWEPGPRPALTVLRAKPCPLLTAEGRCSVYDVRPYSCRRWMCGRTDPAQPVEDAPVPMRVLQSAELTEDYRKLQAAAQPWALAHGWKEHWT